MRFNDTLNHQLHAGGQAGTVIVRACNTTSSAVAIRIFNTPNVPGQNTIDILGVDADNASVYGDSVPANLTYDYEMDAALPILVYNGTGNSISWSLKRG